MSVVCLSCGDVVWLVIIVLIWGFNFVVMKLGLKGLLLFLMGVLCFFVVVLLILLLVKWLVGLLVCYLLGYGFV